MGCDIHLIVELQQDDGTWVRVPDSAAPEPTSKYDCHDWEPHRWYYLFYALAGVRYGGQEKDPIDEPRGLPADISEGAEHDEDGGYSIVDWDRAGGHSASWLTVAELLATDWAGYNTGDRFRLEENYFVTTLLPAMAALHEDPERVRIVFVFDS